MIYFIDSSNKIFYIMAPKCGTTTIAHILNTNIQHEYTSADFSKLNDPEYKKIIIIRSVINRFLSGFYEDLFNNSCYDNINITFNDYLLFLYKCFLEKIPNVNNMNIYNGLNIPIWYGNCSNLISNITNENGDFCSHIMSQKYAISNITNIINCKNVHIVDLEDLSSILQIIYGNDIKKNGKKKLKKIQNGINFSDLILSDIKHNNIIISNNSLDEKQKQIILDMYKEDMEFICELKQKFKTEF